MMYATIVNCLNICCPDRIFFPFLADCDDCPNKDVHYGVITEICKNDSGKKEKDGVD